LLIPPTDRHNFVRVIQIHAFDSDRSPENLRRKGDCQMFFEHREESDSLFGLTVRVDDGFFHEFVEPALAEDGMRGLASAVVSFAGVALATSPV
jgi:hypothetical protein